MADALRALVDVWAIRKNTSQVRRKTCVQNIALAHRCDTSVWGKEFPTVAGVPILPKEVALSAVALVGAVDVCTLLAAWAGQALVHIWRSEVRAHYCQSLIREFPSTHVNKRTLLNQLFLLLPGKGAE